MVTYGLLRAANEPRHRRRAFPVGMRTVFDLHHPAYLRGTMGSLDDDDVVGEWRRRKKRRRGEQERTDADARSEHDLDSIGDG